MIKVDIVNEVSKTADITKVKAEVAVDAVFDAMRLSMQRGRTVGEYINRLLVKIRPHALDLVEAFGYGDDHVRAAVATGAEKERQDEARAYFRSQRASGQAPVDEKVLLARTAAAKRN